MARKKDVIRKIDQKGKASGAPLPLIQEDQPTPPAFALIPEPTDLVLVGQAIMRSTQAPLVAVAIRWQEAPNISPDYYNVDYSENVDFSNSQRRRALTTSATIDSLKANGVTYYFRVQAVVSGIYSPFSNILTVVTMLDDTPPPEVIGAAAAFEYSNLVISYVVPNSEIIKDVEIKIYNAAHTILYGTFYTRSERFVWTAEQNIFATGGIPLTQVSVDIHTRSWSNQLSLTGVNVTTTAPLPATPTGYTSNWIGDTGIASGDFVTAWLSALNADSYDVTIDGIAYSTKDTRFVYRYDQNVRDHAPTLPSGDASFIWLLKSRDKLGQVSTPVNVTVTNAAPPSGVMSMAVQGGFSTIGATVSLIGNTIVQDFDHYEWAISSGSTVVQTFNTPDPSVIFQLGVAGTYTPSVRMVDRFNQKSAVVNGAATLIDTLTIEQLRAETSYSDSFNTNFAAGAVNQVLKNGILYTGSLSDSIRYATTSGTWNWVKATRPLMDRYKATTFSSAWPTNATFYLEYNNGVTSTYYAGPITVTSVNEYIFTQYATQVLARTNAVNLGAASNSGAGGLRFNTPVIQEARDITLWFKTNGGNFDLYEFYPRRLVQSDDIEAESIRSINIAAAGINADRIFAVTLSALSAFIGQLNIDATGWLYQGTGTGASPTTGLKIFNSGGIGKLSTYNSGVEQITLDTDGKLKAGAGAVLLDANGITVNARFPTPGYGAPTTTGVKWVYSGLTVATIEGLVVDDTPDWYTMEFKNTYQANSQTNILASFAINFVSGNAGVILSAGSGGAHGLLSLNATTDIRMNGGDLLVGYTGGGELVVFGQGSITGGLSVSSTINPTRNISIFQDNGYISWNNTAGTEQWVAGLETSVGGRWVLYNDSTAGYAIIIDTSSNVGIDSVPTSKFQVQGGTGEGIYVSNSAPRVILGNHVTYGSRTKGLVLALATATNHFIGGTSNGDGLLYTESGVLWFGANTTIDMGIGTGHNVSIANKLMIGTLAAVPTHTLQLSNDDAAKTTTTTWATTSTKQAKDKIKTRKSALARIKQLRLTDYETNGKYNTIEGAKGVGFIAEEAKLVYPNAVKEVSYIDTDGIEQHYLTFNPHEVFMDYAVAIQELEAEIEALKAKQK